MGYNTTYKVYVVNDTPAKWTLDKDLARISDYVFDDGEAHDIKWYEHDAEMKLLSKEHPDTIYEVRGNGEDESDVWVSFYKDGKSYKVNLAPVYPAFDEGLLR